jgi:hypothetical protein
MTPESLNVCWHLTQGHGARLQLARAQARLVFADE